MSDNIDNSIVLPVSPEGKEYEDQVSAIFQAAGYFVEKNISEDNVLELDLIATEYNSDLPIQYLIEVKSGSWGFKEVFKVKGWMLYLNIDRGFFIVKNTVDELLRQKAAKLSIALLEVSDNINLTGSICNLIQCHYFDENELDSWRFSYWVERILVDNLIHKKKSNKGTKRYLAMLNYYNTINHDIFFSENIIDKVEAIYTTYHNNPNLSARVGNEMLGHDFEGQYTEIPSEVFKSNYYKCNDTDINTSSFIEYRSRLALLKAAVDYISFKEGGVTNKVDKKFVWNIGEKAITVDFYETLPASFKNGVSTLSQHKHYRRYPVFWQYFMWLMGGFILKDYEDKEIEFLSNRTSIPVDEINNAFNAFQILFPTASGWFVNMPNSNVTILKNFPIPFSGIGANWRRYLHTTSENFEDLQLKGLHTYHDLLKWNKVTHDLLKPHYKK